MVIGETGLLVGNKFRGRLTGEQTDKFDQFCMRSIYVGGGFHATFTLFFLCPTVFSHIVPETSSRGRSTALSWVVFTRQRLTKGNHPLGPINRATFAMEPPTPNRGAIWLGCARP